MTAALLALLSAWSAATPNFEKETAVVLTTAPILGVADAAYPIPGYGPSRFYFIRGSSAIYSATTADGVTMTEENVVRLSSETAPAVDVAVSSITGLSILPLDAGGFRMVYSVYGTTGAYRLYSATSTDGLAWSNDTGTVVNATTTFAGHPTLVELQSGDWRLYWTQDFDGGDSPADYRLFSALSTNEGRNWGAPSVVLSTRVGQAAAVRLTNNRVRLYYTQPLSGQTTNSTLISALSTNVNGTSFTAETGVRLSTNAAEAIRHPFVVRATDTWNWRVYYEYVANGKTTGPAHSAITDDPDPQSVSPSTVLFMDPAGTFTIGGEAFSTGVSAVLSRGGQPNIAGAGLTRTDDQTLTVTFNTQNQALGHWNLTVTNASGASATLTNAVLIDFPGGDVKITDNLMRPRAGTQAQIDVTTYDAGRVSVRVYTNDGKPVATLADEHRAAGTFTLFWDGRNSAGAVVASGLYLVETRGPKVKAVDKVVVIK